MTELDLYKFIHYNNVEVHIFKDGNAVENCSEFDDDNMDEWSIMIYPLISQLQSFIDIQDYSVFDEREIEVHLRRGYVAIELLEIMNYYNIDPKNVFK